MSSKKRAPEELELESDEGEFQVLLAAKVSNDGEWEYLVKWAGYDDPNEDTWEPGENVAECQRLLASFWKDIGVDNKDYEAGYVVHASKKYIETEKAYFKRTFVRSKPPKKKQRTASLSSKSGTPQPKTKKDSKKRDSDLSYKTRKNSAFTDPISSDDEPLSHKANNLSSKSITPQPKPKKKKKESEPGKPRKGSVNSESNDSPRTTPQPTPKDSTAKTDDLGLFDDDKPISMRNASSSSVMADTTVAPGPLDDQPPQPVRKASQSSVVPDELGDQRSGSARKVSEGTSQHAADSPDNERQLFETLVPESSLDAGQSSSAPVSTNQPMKTVKKAPTLPARRPARTKSANATPLAGSVLSTKQRLAMGALTPTMPRAVPKAELNPGKGLNSHVLKGLPPIKKTTREQPTLSVSTSVEPSNSVEPTPTSASHINLSPSLPFQSSTTQKTPQTPFQAPVFSNEFSSEPEPMQNEPPEDPLMQQTEAFLANMMPPEMAAPMPDSNPIEAVSSEPMLIPPKSLSKPKAPAVAMKFHKWSWTGTLTVKLENEWDSLCDVVITDSVSRVRDGMPFSVMNEMVDLRFERLYEHVDVEMVLKACKPVTQLARLAPQKKPDDKIKEFTGLIRHMEFYKRVAFVPIFIDGNVAGQMLFFPPSLLELFTLLDVPPEFKNNPLIVALFPWALSPQEIEQESQQLVLPTDLVADFNVDGLDEKDQSPLAKIMRKPALNLQVQHAVRILSWPISLHQHMISGGDREYCIWDRTLKGENGVNHETTLLERILSLYDKASNAGRYKDVRIVFIHVRALKTLHFLPGLPERLAKRLDSMFVTYGTDEDVHPLLWGMREIFLVGGIVTFTPDALVEDPIGILDRISQIAEHPLWASYIIPSVLGMAVKRLYRDQDPLVAFDRGEFIFDFLLTAIERGEIALMRAPPDDYAAGGGVPGLSWDKQKFNDSLSSWTADQVSSMIRDRRETLGFCLEEFNSVYRDMEESKISQSLGTDIVNDFLSMRCQRAIMREYRRFVILKAANDRISPDENVFECSTVTSFDFRDDFLLYQPSYLVPKISKPQGS